AGADAERGDVAARELGVRVNERGGRRSARDRLERERARAAEEVEDAKAADVAEHREDRLARAVGGRPDGARAPRRARDAPAAERAGDDPHAAIASARSSPKRARAASASGPSAGDSSEPCSSSRAISSRRAETRR